MGKRRGCGNGYLKYGGVVALAVVVLGWPSASRAETGVSLLATLPRDEALATVQARTTDPATALDLWRTFADIFADSYDGDPPAASLAWRTPLALLELTVGDPAAARAHSETVRTTLPVGTETVWRELHAWIAAEASRRLGAHREARTAFAALADTGHRDLHRLARLMALRLAADAGDWTAARTHRAALAASGAVSYTYAGDIVLTAASWEKGRLGEALAWLPVIPDQPGQAPENALRGWLAGQLGDHLHAAGQPHDALVAYAWMRPAKRLMAPLQTYRERLAARLAGMLPRHPHELVVTLFWRERLAAIDALLATLAEPPMAAVAQQHRHAEALLAAGRPDEAEALLAAMSARAEEASPQAAATAYRQLVALYAAERDEAFAAAAEAFRARWSETPEAWDVGRLEVAWELRQGRTERALARADRLLAEPLEPRERVHLLRLAATAEISAERFARARERLAEARQLAPHPALQRACTWEHALTWYQESNYSAAAKAFAQLDETWADDDALRPELAFHQARVLYAQNHYDEAERATLRWQARWPRHPRAPAVRALRGDLLMARGDLATAELVWARFTPHDGMLFAHAQQQRLRIWERLLPPIALRQRVTLLLDRHGPQLSAEPFLDAVRRSTRQEDTDSDTLLQRWAAARWADWRDDPARTGLTPMLEVLFADDREALETALVAAHEAEAWTRWSRLMAYQAARAQTDAGRLAVGLKVATAPWSQLPDEALATAGEALAAAGRERAREAWRELLRRNASGTHTVAAHAGLARLAVEAGDGGALRRHTSAVLRRAPHTRIAAAMRLLRARQAWADRDAAATRDEAEAIIAEPLARGRLHAEALALLAQTAFARGALESGLAYDQRLYTAYRGFPTLAARAYARSARALMAAGRDDEARSVWQALRARGELAGTAAWQEAATALESEADAAPGNRLAPTP